MQKNTPIFLKKIRKKESKVTSTDRLEKAAKWLALYAAVLTTIVTTYTLIEKFSPKKHEVEIYVSNFNTTDKDLEFTIAYYNTGDYAEVLSSVQLFLDQAIEESKYPIRWDQAKCNEPSLIEPGKTVYKTYKSKIDFNSEDLQTFPTQKQSFKLSLHFDFLSKEHGMASERFTVASLTPYEREAFLGQAEVQFITTKKRVDFADAKPVVTISSYPRSPRYLNPSFCGKNI